MTAIDTGDTASPNTGHTAFRPSHLYGYLMLLAFAVLLALLQPVAWAQESTPQGAQLDPPGRVARLNLAEGAVSFAPGDSGNPAEASAWTPAVLNRPLTAGDRLWTGPGARSELYVGSTALRMNSQTSLDFQALDDNTTQLRLAQGTLKLRVRALYEGQRLEVDTPNLAFVVSQPGDYRLDVDPAGNTTRVVAQSGSGVIYGDGVAPVTLESRQQANFSGTQLTPAAPGAAQQDSFDLWAADRDRREDQSVSARYIPRETVGYQQLDSYGNWSQDPAYGPVWIPRAVPANWAPYRVGHWAWVSPWGWTWVDDAPWGFAPFHYGRWAQIGPRWAWVPGRLAPRPVYAPALVAFVGGSSGGVNWNISIGGAPRPGVGWFPLAPGEAFRPAYRVSPRYVTQVNHNIVVNNTVNVTNIYRYQRQPAAVTAVSRDDFMRGRPVHGQQFRLNNADLNRAQLVADRSALPQRPAQAELRERQRPVTATALPPPAVAARPVVSSRDDRPDERRDGRRDENRDGQRADRRDASAPGRADARRDDPRAGQAPGRDQDARPQPTAPAAAPAAAQAVPRQAPTQGRNALEASQRAQREQQQQQAGRDAQRRQQQAPQADESIGQRALREQAQRDAQARAEARAQAANADARAATDRHAAEQAQRIQQQAQREQQRQQREQLQAPQLEQQRRLGEEPIGQRALREQAQRDQENARQQQAAQRQQHLQQQQQQRAQQDQQRQAQAQAHAQEQQQRQQQQQAQRDAAQRSREAAADKPATPQADAANPRGPRSEGGLGRNREQ
jgi:DNA segregation ATPase FtsK/SpoIIIE-like protein